MTRNASTTGLLLASISAILGSGWLFAAYYTTLYAGYASIISWVIGAALVTIIAFVFAEVCTTVPVSGSSAKIPHYTHGTVTSYTFSWIIWLSYLTLAPTEVQAIIQYISYYFPILVHTNGGLTEYGLLLATTLMLFITILNGYSLKWLLKANAFLTIFKLLIPLFIGAVILYHFLPQGHLTHNIKNNFAPFGWHGTLQAVSIGGIAFAFTGFKVSAEMAGSTKNPKVALPIAIVGSVIICLIVFLIIQFAFLSSIPVNQSFQHIQTNDQFGPFASIAHQANMSWLMPFIFAGAMIGPFAAGLIYFGSAARSLHGMSENGYLPNLLTKLSPTGVPIFSIAFSFFVGMLMFAPFPGWEQMVKFLTALMAMTYLTASTSLITLRYRMPEMKRPFKLIIGKTWAIVGFYASTLIIYWSGWDIISKVGITVLIGLAILIVYLKISKKDIPLNFKQSTWIWVYLIGITLISYAGDYGGHSLISPTWAFILMAILSIISMLMAMFFTLPKETIQSRIQKALE